MLLRLAAVAVLLAATPAWAQGEALRLIQTGRWDQARQLAADALADADRPAVERCEWGLYLAAAHLRLGQEPAARDAFRASERACTALPAVTWLRGYRDELAADLAPPPPPTVRPGDGWTLGDPAALGVDTTALALHLALCQSSRADACLVAVRGQIVQEWYGPEYREPMLTGSVVKSWTGLLAGLLVADGALALDDPTARWVPEWTAGAQGGVTVRHLLTMSAGLDIRPQGGVGSAAGGDKAAFVFGLPLDWAPGTRWEYSNEGALLLSPILARAAGVPLQDYARDRLFGPLGMTDTRLKVDAAGTAWTEGDAETTLRDFAKPAQLVAAEGVWDGRQVVLADWVRTMTAASATNPRYGMLWWRVETSDRTLVMASGHPGNLYLIDPVSDVVLVRMQKAPRAETQRYALDYVASLIDWLLPDGP